MLRAALACVLLLIGGAPAAARTGCSRIEMFSRADCPHCVRAREFLADLRTTQPDLEIRIVDVERDVAARERLRELADRHGVRMIGVPAFAICDAFLIGFDDAAIYEISSAPRTPLLHTPSAGAAAAFDVWRNKADRTQY